MEFGTRTTHETILRMMTVRFIQSITKVFSRSNGQDDGELCLARKIWMDLITCRTIWYRSAPEVRFKSMQAEVHLTHMGGDYAENQQLLIDWLKTQNAYGFARLCRYQ